MLLQPIVENSIKHGWRQKLTAARSPYATASVDGRLVIEVER